MSTMEITTIDIKNYKGFLSTAIEFHPKLNVLIGSNGAGKTSILNALAKSLYSITHAFAAAEGDITQLTIHPEEVNYGTNYCMIRSSFIFPNYDSKVLTVAATGNFSTDDRVEIDNINLERNNFVNWFAKIIRNGPLTIPIVKFYPANRGSLKYNEAQSSRSYVISQLETWANIYQNSLSYSKFFKWFVENETNELLLQRDAKDFNIQNPTLSDVRKALQLTLELLGYPKSKIKSKQIKRQGSSRLVPTLVLENLENRQEESLDNKSDGEKAIVTLIADIAYNLSLAKDFSNSNNFLNSPGVVLIDEIETHLHPNWQRKIIPILSNVFPNIQFFIATHSPQIVSSVKSDSIFVCDNFQIHPVRLKTFGEDTNSLLKYIFNSTERPKPYVDLLEKFNVLIERESDYKALELVIDEIKSLERIDNASNLSNLVDELNIRLEAYKFDKEHEENK
jgi:predicted ATP-binding protein involved in virulence